MDLIYFQKSLGYLLIQLLECKINQLAYYYLKFSSWGSLYKPVSLKSGPIVVGES